MIQAKLYFDNELPSSGAGIQAGIHDKGDLQFLGLQSGPNYWDLRFGNEAGQFIHKRLFEPNANFINDGESPSEALQRSIDKNVRIVVDVLRVFLGEAAGTLEAEDYDSFMELASKELEAWQGVAVCLKVMPDKKGDKTYAKIPDYKFIDSYMKGFPTSLYWTKKEKEKLEAAGIAA